MKHRPNHLSSREPLDQVLGLIWDADPGRSELISFHDNSRRFQTWEEQ